MAILNRIKIDRVWEWTVCKLALSCRDRNFASKAVELRTFAIGRKDRSRLT